MLKKQLFLLALVSILLTLIASIHSLPVKKQSAGPVEDSENDEEPTVLEHPDESDEDEHPVTRTPKTVRTQARPPPPKSSEEEDDATPPTVSLEPKANNKASKSANTSKPTAGEKSPEQVEDDSTADGKATENTSDENHPRIPPRPRMPPRKPSPLLRNELHESPEAGIDTADDDGSPGQESVEGDSEEFSELQLYNPQNEDLQGSLTAANLLTVLGIPPSAPFIQVLLAAYSLPNGPQLVENILSQILLIDDNLLISLVYALGDGALESQGITQKDFNNFLLFDDRETLHLIKRLFAETNKDNSPIKILPNKLDRPQFEGPFQERFNQPPFQNPPPLPIQSVVLADKQITNVEESSGNIDKHFPSPSSPTPNDAPPYPTNLQSPHELQGAPRVPAPPPLLTQINSPHQFPFNGQYPPPPLN